MRAAQAAFLQSVLTARCAASVAAAPHGAASGKQALGNAQQQSVHNASPCCGAAVGPHWVQQLQLLAGEGGTAGAGAVAGVRVELSCELASLRAAPAPADWPVLATLTSGEQLGVDVVILATGVEPSVEWCVRSCQHCSIRRACSRAAAALDPAADKATKILQDAGKL